jgi:hypothetical protein
MGNGNGGIEIMRAARTAMHRTSSTTAVLATNHETRCTHEAA